MIVVDASIVVHLIVDAAVDPSIVELVRRAERLTAPHIIDLEVLNALRRHRQYKKISPERLTIALADFASIPIERHTTNHLNSRIWQLCNNLTPYDACYIALAEELNIPLLSRDAKMSGAPNLSANVIIV